MIAGKGTHDELMKESEIYRGIALSQLKPGGFIMITAVILQQIVFCKGWSYGGRGPMAVSDGNDE